MGLGLSKVAPCFLVAEPGAEPGSFTALTPEALRRPRRLRSQPKLHLKSKRSRWSIEEYRILGENL